jgi:hypothetical protein
MEGKAARVKNMSAERRKKERKTAGNERRP